MAENKHLMSLLKVLKFLSTLIWMVEFSPLLPDQKFCVSYIQQVKICSVLPDFTTKVEGLSLRVSCNQLTNQVILATFETFCGRVCLQTL